MSTTSPPMPLEVYARILAELGQAGNDPERVLHAHGLDEAAWEQVEAYWDAALDAEELGDEEVPSVPRVLGALVEELTRAQPAAERSAVSFDDFLELLAVMRATSDPVEQLRRRGVELTTFLEAQRYWLARIINDPELRARYIAAQG